MCISLFLDFFPLIKFLLNRKLTFQRDSKFASFHLEILSFNVSLKVLRSSGLCSLLVNSWEGYPVSGWVRSVSGSVAN